MRAQSFCPWTLEHRLNSCGAQAELLQGMWDLLRSGTSRILCHWATGEALLLFSNPGPIKDVAVWDPEGNPEWSSNCPFSGCVCMWSPCDWWASQATSGPGTHGYSALSSDCSSTCEKAVYKFYHSSTIYYMSLFCEENFPPQLLFAFSHCQEHTDSFF